MDMDMENVRVVVADLPTSVNAYTICNDDFYTIVINDRISNEQRHKAYLHEMLHINNKDFGCSASVGLIEIKTHRKE